MKRRDFLKKAGVVAASASVSPLMFAKAQDRQVYSWGMPTSWPTSLDNLYGGAVDLADYLREMTDGQIDIEVFPAGAQIGGLEVFDAVASGAFEVGHTASYYYIGKDPAHAFFTCIPFGMTAPQLNAWVYSGGGQELWDELNARNNMIALLSGNTGMQMAGWFNKEISSPEDLRGLSFRTAGLGAQVYAAAGVNVQTLPGGEIFLALERGVLDAADWVGPHDDEILGMNQAAQFYYGPGWAEPGAGFSTYINLDAWNSLTPALQKAFRVAAKAVNSQMYSNYNAADPAAFARMVASGTQPRVFSNDILQTFFASWTGINDEMRASNEMYSRISDSVTAFLAELRPYDEGNQFAFLNFVYGQD
ncbi:MAG TPA: TRAP transporter substrate-binding protein DctP [Trueperaceae bacterium]|nr:TRAP transporter substrate-binding protein DctP [Trueperaceae bacterium]